MGIARHFQSTSLSPASFCFLEQIIFKMPLSGEPRTDAACPYAASLTNQAFPLYEGGFFAGTCAGSTGNTYFVTASSLKNSSEIRLKSIYFGRLNFHSSKATLGFLIENPCFQQIIQLVAQNGNSRMGVGSGRQAGQVPEVGWTRPAFCFCGTVGCLGAISLEPTNFLRLCGSARWKECLWVQTAAASDSAPRAQSS